MSFVNTAISQLKIDEGYRKHPYKDSVGVLTVGYGRNLESDGISESESAQLLRNNVMQALNDLAAKDWWPLLNDARKAVLINMRVNLGMPRLMGFRRMIEAINNRDYSKAAAEMLDSKWASQVGERAERLAEHMKTGV